MTKDRRLTPGDRAPDLTLLDVNGQPITLSDHWANGPTVLTFLRHFG